MIWIILQSLGSFWLNTLLRCVLGVEGVGWVDNSKQSYFWQNPEVLFYANKKKRFPTGIKLSNNM
jgi:hypothetical protein